MADQERVGARIAVIRKTRGWTGRELARRAHVSYSLLAKVESGAAPASPALIGAVARALRVDVPRLTGQPYEEPRGQAARLHEMIPPIRRSVDTYDLPDDSITPRPFAELAADARRLSGYGQAGKFAQIGAELPGLLDELSAAVCEEVHPIDDQRSTAHYRRQVSGVILKRAIEKAARLQ